MKVRFKEIKSIYDLPVNSGYREDFGFRADLTWSEIFEDSDYEKEYLFYSETAFFMLEGENGLEFPAIGRVYFDRNADFSEEPDSSTYYFYGVAMKYLCGVDECDEFLSGCIYARPISYVTPGFGYNVVG